MPTSLWSHNKSTSSMNAVNTVIKSYRALISGNVSTGIHPSLESLTVSEQSVSACMVAQGQCSFNYFIKVKKCQEEILYYLSPTMSGGVNSYCFSKWTYKKSYWKKHTLNVSPSVYMNCVLFIVNIKRSL